MIEQNELNLKYLKMKGRHQFAAGGLASVSVPGSWGTLHFTSVYIFQEFLLKR